MTSVNTFLPDASLIWGAASLQSGASRVIPWLWEGYLAPGALTLLTSQWKSGKTTLVSILLAKLKTGGQLAGLSLAPGKAVVVSEEPRTSGRSAAIGWISATTSAGSAGPSPASPPPATGSR